jgi:hypothetical protein
MQNNIVKTELPYKNEDYIGFLSSQEQLQQDLFRVYWLYAFPPQDGQDLYRSQGGFFTRSNARSDAADGSFAKARGLRKNTRAIFNFIPQIVAKNFELLSNQASPDGLTVYDEDGKKNDQLTQQAQNILKKTWRDFFSEMLAAGLVTGQAYLVPTIVDGKINIQVLYPNYVFVTRGNSDISEINKVEVKYLYKDNNGDRHEYYQLLDKEQVLVQVDGETTFQQSNQWGRVPVVHIRNQPTPGEVYGRNCFASHLSDVDEICQLAGDWLRAVSIYGHPKYIIQGASVPTEIKSDVGQVIELPEGGSISVLEYSKLDSHWDKILSMSEAIKRKIPEFDLVNVESGSVNASGYAIRLKLSSLEAKIMSEQKQYEAGIEDAIRWCLNLLGNKAPNWVDYDIKMDMGPVLPGNIMDVIAETEKMALNGWITKEQAMRAIGRSEQEIQEVLDSEDREMDLASEWEQEMSRKKPPKPSKFTDPATGKVYQGSLDGTLEEID